MKHPEVAVGLSNLSELYRQTGDYRRAERTQLAAFKIRQETLGNQHPVYAASLNNLAAIYQRMQQPTLAEPLLLEAKDIFAMTVGTEHASYATSVNNLAMLYRSVGDHANAKSMFAESAAVFRQAFGTEHPAYAASINTLAAFQDTIGDDVQAEHNAWAGHHSLVKAANRVLPALSHAQAQGWIRSHAPRTGLLLSILRRRNRLDSPQAYSAVWQSKQMISRLCVGQTLPPDHSPAAKETLATLRQTRQRLVRLVMMTPSPQQASSYLTDLADANNRKEQLEKELARLNPASKRVFAIRDATVEDLVQQLPKGIAVVDLVRSYDWQFAVKEVEINTSAGAEKRSVHVESKEPVYDCVCVAIGSTTGGQFTSCLDSTGTCRPHRVGSRKLAPQHCLPGKCRRA